MEPTQHAGSATGRLSADPAEFEERRLWPLAMAGLLIGFLAFVIGAFTMYRGVFPADVLRPAFQGGVALFDRLTAYDDPVKTDFWQPARSEARGVVRHDPAKAQPGMTLYTSGHDQRAFLIGMDGRVLHQWALPYSRVWDKSSAVAKPQSDRFIYFEKAHVYPNGDLLALYAAIGDTPWGYGLVKMDKDSKVIWKYLGHAHHGFDIDAEGNIYVLSQEITKKEIPGFAWLTKPRIDDFVVKLSPDGRELSRMWLTAAFAQSPYGRRLFFVPSNVHQGGGPNSGDYLHANSVQVLRNPVPAVEGSKPGQVLVSLREISTVALADLETQKVGWAMSGSWVRQHDAQFLNNGRLLLFDNEGNPNGHGLSRVLELDPATNQVQWSYGGRPDQRLDSVQRSSQNRLANGNTLIVESMAGRLIEVTPQGEVAWEFVNPVRGGEKQDRVPIIFWVQRLDPGKDFAPEFRDRLGAK